MLSFGFLDSVSPIKPVVSRDLLTVEPKTDIQSAESAMKMSLFPTRRCSQTPPVTAFIRAAPSQNCSSPIKNPPER